MTSPSVVRRKFFLLRSMRSELKCFSNELIAWLTADWLTPLICAALVKLSVSARSQKTLRLSKCIMALNRKAASLSTNVCRQRLAPQAARPAPRTRSGAGRYRVGWIHSPHDDTDEHRRGGDDQLLPDRG